MELIFLELDTNELYACFWFTYYSAGSSKQEENNTSKYSKSITTKSKKSRSTINSNAVYSMFSFWLNNNYKHNLPALYYNNKQYDGEK